ncbi:MAG: FKBP-type peptidyl-prolyl cis-trans isomerase, partial [Muribaculaceae bacterium]|nr:FKBP-type peptidyl-prolyl cis-trans isomerase [Muribaculaceae bacterium]
PPTSVPGAAPTSVPGAPPTSVPGAPPTSVPGAPPTSVPGAPPTAVPGAAPTAVPGAAPTAVPGGARPSAPGAISDIPVLDEYVINGIRYKVDKEESRRTLKTRSGEARILVVENGGRKFVLKLYIPNHGPNHNILEKVKNARGGFLVSLRDHGKWGDARGMQFDYEIMDYAPNGSLADMTLRGSETRFKEVAMRMAFAIRQCHELGFIHRDIKPENFLFTGPERKEFVVIDFGIAREISGDNPVKVDAAKSSYFVSPEGAISSNDRNTYVGRATDYYSMGMTLLALWMGVDNFYKMFPANDLAELDRLKRNNNVIGKLRSKLNISDHLASLLERLLEFSDGSRAGFDDVQRWFKGETLKTGSAAEAEHATGDFHVVFNDVKKQVARSPKELAALMLGDVEFAKKFLYKGLAKSALQGIRPTLAIEIDDIVNVKYPRPEEQGGGVYAAALLLDPSSPFFGVKGNKCVTAKEIAAEVWTNRQAYIKDLASRGSALWVYMTIRGDSAMRALPDKYRPIIVSDGQHGIYALVKKLDPSLPFYSIGGKELRDQKAIAAELWGERRTYASQLAMDNHMLWTYMLSLGPNAAEIERKYRPMFKFGADELDKNINRLYKLCLALDPSFPLYSPKGKALRTDSDLAACFLDSWIGASKELSDPDHQVWSFLAAKGGKWAEIARTYPGLLAKSNNQYLWDVYYRLGSDAKPFSVQRKDDNKWYYVYSMDEFAKEIHDHGVTPLTMECLSRVHFPTWLLNNRCKEDAKLAPVLEKLVKEAGSNAKNRGWYMFYALMPNVSLNCSTDKGKEHYIYSAADIGRALNLEMSTESRTYMMNSSAPNIFTMLTDGVDNFRKSQLHQYLEARKMTAQADGIARIVDLPANRKAHPAAPYTKFTAAWKVIQYLGYTPYFTFPKANVKATTLAQVKSVSQEERNQLIKDSALPQFLALFFHEGIKNTYSVTELRGYFNFLQQYAPAYPGMSKAMASIARVDNAIEARDKAWAGVKRKRTLITLLCLLPMLVLLIWMMAVTLTEGSATVIKAFEAIGTFVAVLLAIVGGLAGLSGGIIGAIIGALAGYWIPTWIFGLLSGFAPFLLVLLLGAAAVWCAVKFFNQTSDKYIPNKAKYDDLVEQADIYKMCEAFGTTSATFGSSNPDPSSIFQKSTQLAKDQSKSSGVAAWCMIGLTVITLVITVLLTDSVNAVDKQELVETAAEPAHPNQLPGTFKGEFHERPATLFMSKTDDGTIKGKLRIEYSTPMTINLVVDGYDGDTGKLTMHSTESSSITLAADVYYGDGNKVYMTGEYVNNLKGTRHNFYLSKNQVVAPYGGYLIAPSGLRYRLISVGSGRSPKDNSTVSVKYKGMLPDGTVFDEAVEPVEFNLKNVIPGFAEGVKMLREGGHAMLYIPADMAYGEKGVEGSIPPDADLVFDVELVKVK